MSARQPPKRHFMLRLTDELLQAIRDLAQREHRSMHAQIIHSVSESVAQQPARLRAPVATTLGEE